VRTKGRPAPSSPRRGLLLATLFGALAVSSATGCAPPKTPSDTLRAYAQAIEDNNLEQAYALLSTEAKRSLSLDAFRRMVRESPADAKELARALARPSSDPLVTATATTTTGDEITLVFEHGVWRVDGQSIDLYGQATPKQAVKAFLRAFERKRYDILMRFVPDAKKGDGPLPPLDEARLRESWEGPQKDDMRRVAQGVAAALATQPIEESADHAALPYGGSGTLTLVREHGVWKIEKFD
jgi:hypothetical protein